MLNPATSNNAAFPVLRVFKHPVRWLALIALCAPFVHHALIRFMDFDLAISEMENVGLLPSVPIAAAAIVVQILCSILIVSGFLRWIGAIALSLSTSAWAVFTLPFWRMRHDLEGIAAADAFMLHIAVAGGLLLIAWYDLHLWRTRGTD